MHGEGSVSSPGVRPPDESSPLLMHPIRQHPKKLTNLSLQEWEVEFIIYIVKAAELWA